MEVTGGLSRVGRAYERIAVLSTIQSLNMYSTIGEVPRKSPCVRLRTAIERKCLHPGALVYITGFMAWAGCVTPLCVWAGAWAVTL